jgi:ribose transport system permease protein
MRRRLLPSFLAGDWQGLALLAVLGSLLLALFQPAFLSEFNLYVLLTSFALMALVAMSQMIIIGLGQMNLAVGAIGGLVAVAFAGFMDVWHLPPLLAALLGLAVGLLAGFANGLLTHLTGISAFVITLATLSIFKGINIGITEAQPFYGVAESVKWFGNARLGPLPVLLIAPVIVVPLVALLMNRTVLGRQILAVGGNRSAAELSGIEIGRVITAAHAVSGLLAGIAGMLAVARLQTGQPTIGDDWLILSFAAPVIGGAVLTGGYVSVAGTCLGVVIVSLINNALVLLGIDPFFVQLLLGLLILAAVGLNRLREATAASAGAAA